MFTIANDNWELYMTKSCVRPGPYIDRARAAVNIFSPPPAGRIYDMANFSLNISVEYLSIKI